METDRNQPSELRILKKNSSDSQDIESPFPTPFTKNTILKNSIKKQINYFLLFNLKTITFFTTILLHITQNFSKTYSTKIIAISQISLEIIFYIINKNNLKKKEKRLFIIKLITKTSIFLQIIFLLIKKMQIHSLITTLIILFILDIYSNCFISDSVK